MWAGNQTEEVGVAPFSITLRDPLGDLIPILANVSSTRLEVLVAQVEKEMHAAENRVRSS